MRHTVFSNTVKKYFGGKNLDSQENVDIYNHFLYKAICSQFKCHI